MKSPYTFTLCALALTGIFAVHGHAAAPGDTQPQLVPAVPPMLLPGPELDAVLARAEKGDLQAQIQAAEYFERSFTPDRSKPDLKQAQHWREAAAKQGDKMSAIWLADRYEHLTPPDYAQAMAWYEVALEHGSDYAQFRLARMYETGHGTPVRFDLALSKYESLSAAGLPNLSDAASFRLGMMYEHGVGVPLDLDKARQYYEVAKQQGSAAAAARLALALNAPPLLAPDVSAAQGDVHRYCNNSSEVGESLNEKVSAFASRAKMDQLSASANVTVGGTGAIEDVSITKMSVNSLWLKLKLRDTLYAWRCIGSGKEERFRLEYDFDFRDKLASPAKE